MHRRVALPNQKSENCFSYCLAVLRDREIRFFRCAHILGDYTFVQWTHTNIHTHKQTDKLGSGIGTLTNKDRYFALCRMNVKSDSFLHWKKHDLMRLGYKPLGLHLAVTRIEFGAPMADAKHYASGVMEVVWLTDRLIGRSSDWLIDIRAFNYNHAY